MLSLFLLEGYWALVIYLVAKRAGLKPRPIMIPLVMASAIPTLASGVWGTIFQVEPGSPAAADRPDLIVHMLWYFFYASIVVGLAVPLLAKGYRIPAAIFALPQIPLTWVVGFLGVMQVTGVWL